MQTTSHLLMIRPVQFTFNAETAVNNAFQAARDIDAQELALREFTNFVHLLRKNDVDITVIDDSLEPNTPDSIFPNNWISFHDDGSIVLYPMYAVNRRLERKPHVIDQLNEVFVVKRRIDLSEFERENLFLEGTGSMVLDRNNKIAYACISQRTDEKVLAEFCLKLGYTAHSFRANDANGFPIYHTNVMMCIADRYAVICLESISDQTERDAIVRKIQETNKQVIAISLDQMNHFAGNMLQVENADQNKFLVMSSQAYNSLFPNQVTELMKFNPILHSSLDTIERNGGGSARCMMAEVFLPKRV